ncbi:putative transmembrane protein [Gregarina niphandrodes]|uniref:Transmembrane protein n=1 Tax=Gregarina niphandrodes TaxID=110365 RepID=A0A023BCQ5_GRENI|nr:putative transmembrane protein [Gregarina niphandrodes]EZG83576.1 putative transmembrane protein [Gregarina niphandrodes]|eukprot:XP_011128937.1 putative transmembrane protein [Gregarina niphandrodes]
MARIVHSKIEEAILHGDREASQLVETLGQVLVDKSSHSFQQPPSVPVPIRPPPRLPKPSVMGQCTEEDDSSVLDEALRDETAIDEEAPPEECSAQNFANGGCATVVQIAERCSSAAKETTIPLTRRQLIWRFLVLAVVCVAASPTYLFGPLVQEGVFALDLYRQQMCGEPPHAPSFFFGAPVPQPAAVCAVRHHYVLMLTVLALVFEVLLGGITLTLYHRLPTKLTLSLGLCVRAAALLWGSSLRSLTAHKPPRELTLFFLALGGDPVFFLALVLAVHLLAAYPQRIVGAFMTIRFLAAAVLLYAAHPRPAITATPHYPRREDDYSRHENHYSRREPEDGLAYILDLPGTHLAGQGSLHSSDLQAAADLQAADDDPHDAQPGPPGPNLSGFGPPGLGPAGLGPLGLGPAGLGPPGLGPAGLGPSPSQFEQPPSRFEQPPSRFEQPPSRFEQPPSRLGPGIVAESVSVALFHGSLFVLLAAFLSLALVKRKSFKKDLLAKGSRDRDPWRYSSCLESTAYQDSLKRLESLRSGVANESLKRQLLQSSVIARPSVRNTARQLVSLRGLLLGISTGLSYLVLSTTLGTMRLDNERPALLFVAICALPICCFGKFLAPHITLLYPLLLWFAPRPLSVVSALVLSLLSQCTVFGYFLTRRTFTLLGIILALSGLAALNAFYLVVFRALPTLLCTTALINALLLTALGIKHNSLR